MPSASFTVHSFASARGTAVTASATNTVHVTPRRMSSQVDVSHDCDCGNTLDTAKLDMGGSACKQTAINLPEVEAAIARHAPDVADVLRAMLKRDDRARILALGCVRSGKHGVYKIWQLGVPSAIDKLDVHASAFVTEYVNANDKETNAYNYKLLRRTLRDVVPVPVFRLARATTCGYLVMKCIHQLFCDLGGGLMLWCPNFGAYMHTVQWRRSAAGLSLEYTICFNGVNLYCVLGRIGASPDAEAPSDTSTITQ